MEAELSQLLNDGIAVDDEGVSEVYTDRTSSLLSEEWLTVFEEMESTEFESDSQGVPFLDPKLRVESFENLPDPSESWTHEEEANRFTLERQEFISKVRELANSPSPAYFPIHFESTRTLLPEVQGVRNVALLLRLDAQLAVRKRDASRAHADIQALLELSKHVDAVPFAIARMAGIAIRRFAFECLQEAIQIDLLTDEQLQSIDVRIRPLVDIGARWRTLIEDDMSSNLSTFWNVNSIGKSKTAIPARGIDAIYYINLMKNAADLPADQWTQLDEGSTALELKMEKDTRSLLGSADYIVTNILVPPLNAQAILLINDAQLHRQARIAIALRRYQRVHKRLPQSLDELASDVKSLKLYGDQDFVYRRDGESAVLWGVWLSENQKQVTEQIPDTEQQIADSLDNRRIVWWLK